MIAGYSFLAGILSYSNSVAFLTNATGITSTNQDVIVGSNNVSYAIVSDNIVLDNNGHRINQITNAGCYSVVSPDGWGYQFLATFPNTIGLSSFVPGSLAYETVTNLQTQSNSFANLSAFTTLDAANTNFVPNPTFWLAAFPQRTASVVAEGNPLPNSPQIGGSAISPRHVLNCGHAPYTVGYVLEFVDINGAVIPRTVVASTNWTCCGQPTNGDLNLALLNADLPATIFPFPVLPSSYLSYLPCLTNKAGNFAQVQAVGENQLKQFFPKLWQGTGPFQPLGTNGVNAVSASVWLGTALNVTIGGGDSGHPIMLLDGTNLVLFAHWSTTQGGAGNYGIYFNQINTAMHWLSTNNNLFSDYQLTPADLSAFPIYP